MIPRTLEHAGTDHVSSASTYPWRRRTVGASFSAFARLIPLGNERLLLLTLRTSVPSVPETLSRRHLLDLTPHDGQPLSQFAARRHRFREQLIEAVPDQRKAARPMRVDRALNAPPVGRASVWKASIRPA